MREPHPTGDWESSEYFSGLAAVISEVPLAVKIRTWGDGLEYYAEWPPKMPLKVSVRCVDAECPPTRSLAEYRLGFVYWLAYRLGVIRRGIVDPPTFAELKARWEVAETPLAG